jgi:hypothetical protein
MPKSKLELIRTGENRLRVLKMGLAARRRLNPQAGGPRYVAQASLPASSGGVSPLESYRETLSKHALRQKLCFLGFLMLKIPPHIRVATTLA